MGREAGLKAENFFISVLNSKGINYIYIDDWFDFEILGQKVELKSCKISVKQPKKRKVRFRAGRFDFTKLENREKQFNENVWICFMVTHENQFMILGLCRAKELNKKRYISLTALRSFKPISLDDWIKKYNN